MNIILFDLETTGLLQPDLSALSNQPHIIEIAAYKFNSMTDINTDNYETFTRLVKPPISVSDKITKLTGINDKMLEKELTFSQVLPDLSRFFLNTTLIIAHNLSFDIDVLKFELKRLDKQFLFPWPTDRFCTMNYFEGKFQKKSLAHIHEAVTNKKTTQTHRAEDDLKQLLDVVRFILTQ